MENTSDEDKKELRRIGDEGLDWISDNPNADIDEINIYRETVEQQVNEIYERCSEDITVSDHEDEDEDDQGDDENDDDETLDN